MTTTNLSRNNRKNPGQSLMDIPWDEQHLIYFQLHKDLSLHPSLKLFVNDPSNVSRSEEFFRLIPKLNSKSVSCVTSEGALSEVCVN
jgi:hypothetical protein